MGIIRSEEASAGNGFSLRIPARMRRPSTAREALRFSPLMEAGWAHASRIESIPFDSAGAKPFVFLSWRPSAQRAADAWRFRLAGFPLSSEIAIWNNDRIVSNRTHAFPSRSARCPPNTWIVLVPAITSPPWCTPRGIRYSSPALIRIRFPAISNVWVHVQNAIWLSSAPSNTYPSTPGVA